MDVQERGRTGALLKFQFVFFEFNQFWLLWLVAAGAELWFEYRRLWLLDTHYAFFLGVPTVWGRGVARCT